MCGVTEDTCLTIVERGNPQPSQQFGHVSLGTHVWLSLRVLGHGAVGANMGVTGDTCLTIVESGGRK